MGQVPSFDQLLTRTLHPDQALALVEELGGDERRDLALVALAGASRSLTKSVRHDPTLLDVLEPQTRFENELPELTAPDDVQDLETLRRWKRRKLLRIALRDLLGLADLPEVGRELSLLADACLARALDLTEPDPPLAIIGMGKLGGNELNYASDIDIVFVHDGNLEAATRRARKVIEALTALTEHGAVYRVDTELRPEGNAGPLSRTPDSYQHYFEDWAQAWERQAYIKTRFCAGDADLANAFFDAVKPGVWADELHIDTVDSIRELKLRAEQIAEAKEGREIKRGAGGLRDIEFSAQLLQMVHGRSDPSVRSPNTLTALQQLDTAGYLDKFDHYHFEKAYLYLRTVEHRLQLRDERQTHELPTDEDDQRWLARLLDFEDWEAFQTSHNRYQASVRGIQQRLFYRESLDQAHEITALHEDLVEQLTGLGFEDPERAAANVERLTMGLSRSARLLQQVFGMILKALSVTPDPDLGLVRLAWLLDGSYRTGIITPVLRDSPVAIDNLCRLLGWSRPAANWLRRHPEFARSLASTEEMEAGRRTDELATAAAHAIDWRSDDPEARTMELRRFVRREELRVAARDVCGFASVAEVGEELSYIADAALSAATGALGPDVPFAILALGRYGGLDLSYSSDLDVIFVYDGTTAEDAAAANASARDILREIGAQTPEGKAWEIDARLRPEGESGQLARSLDGYERYYRERGQLWERQALIKRRFVAGDAELGRRFVELVDGWSYQPDFSDEEVQEIRSMKRRIETERLGTGSKALDVKLGVGGLSDIEFTVQLLQLQHGHERSEVRDNRTLPALEALTEAGVVTEQDRDVLRDGYLYCMRFRNARFHLTGLPGDTLPDDDHDQLVLAHEMGHMDTHGLLAEYAECTGTTHKVTQRLFYGAEK